MSVSGRFEGRQTKPSSGKHKINLTGRIDNFYQRLNQSPHKYRQYFILYTIVFALVCVFVFSWYLFAGRTFIWDTDGWHSHYKDLIYYAKYLRNIIRTFLSSGTITLPEWGFALGEGNDILQTLHYYVIGDPFAFFSVLVPTKFMWVYYDFMILLRLYLSGAAFSCLCFYTKKNIGRYAVLAGSVSYAFCYWAILNANRHPYFLNPLLYFPLLILGIEKILKKERPYVFIVSAFFAYVSNFYYCYVLVLMTLAYLVARLIFMYRKDIKTLLATFLKISGFALLAAAMAAVILLPVLYAVLGDGRMSSGVAWHFVYPLSYYSELLGSFFSGTGDYWLHLGYSAPVALAIILLFIKKKKYRFLKICFVIGLVIILIPALGQFLNGLSYRSNKWCWAFALLCTYIFAIMWDELMRIKLKDALKLAAGLSLCLFALLMLEYSRTEAAFACLGISFVFLLVILPLHSKDTSALKRWEKIKPACAFALVVAGVVCLSFFKNAYSQGNYASEGEEIDYVEDNLLLSQSKAVQEAANEDGITDFYRFSGRGLRLEGVSLLGLSKTEYSFSISNSNVIDFRTDLELLGLKPHSYREYDDRTALNSLSSVLYYVIPEDDTAPLPYGFSYVDEFNVSEDITEEALNLLKDELGVDELSDEQINVINNATESVYKVYRNDNALPLAYTYNAVISEETWESFSAIEKQEAMLQGVYLSGFEDDLEDAGSSLKPVSDTGASSAGSDIELTSESIDYTIKCKSSGVTLEDYGFVVTSANSQVTLSFEGLENSETYFCIKGLDFDGVSTYELYFGDDKYDPLNLYTETRWNLLSHSKQESIKRSYLFWVEPTGADITVKASSGVSKTIAYKTEDYSWYNDRHDISACLDYSEDAVTQITLTFSAVGVYSFDSIEIVCQPMKNYETQISELKEYAPDDIEIETDIVTGSVNLDEESILCFSIPYSKGWTAYVDGEEAVLYQANIKNMALVLGAGRHEFKLVYHTPYLRIGILISLAGFAGFAALLVVNLKRRKRRLRDPEEFAGSKKQDHELKGGPAE